MKAYRRIASVVVPFLASAMVPLNASAWNGTGHEAVAQVAWDQLSPAQRQAVCGVLRHHPRYQKDLMADLAPGEDPDEHAFRVAATWPDIVKSPLNPLERTEDHKPWHYVDYPYDSDGKAGPMPAERWDGHAEPANLLQAMQLVTAQLRDPATAPARRAIDLCWLLHLVGDAHQPLHAVGRFSNAYPDGDQGGNACHVATFDNPDTNLHSVWDGAVGRSLAPDAVQAIARRVERSHSPTDERVMRLKTDPKQWVGESFDLAKHNVYLDGLVVGCTREQAAANPDAVPTLPVGYETRARDVADEQIALAGYRAADLIRSLDLHAPTTAATEPAVGAR